MLDWPFIFWDREHNKSGDLCKWHVEQAHKKPKPGPRNQLGLSPPSKNLNLAENSFVFVFNVKSSRYESIGFEFWKLAIHQRINISIGCFQKKEFWFPVFRVFLVSGKGAANYLRYPSRGYSAFRAAGGTNPNKNLSWTKNTSYPSTPSHGSLLVKWWKVQAQEGDFTLWLVTRRHLSDHSKEGSRKTWGCNKEWGLVWFRFRIYGFNNKKVSLLTRPLVGYWGIS